MKKTLLKVASLLALAATLCLTACSSAVTAYDDELAAPEAKLYAYPGVNIISWAAIPNADSYQIWRTVGDAVATVSELNGDDNQKVVYYDADVKLEDTVYTYRIIAIANTPNGVGIMDRTSEVTVSMTTPTALTAEELAEGEPNYAGRFAPFFTSYSDLAKYEADYNEEAEVLAPETIKVEVDANYDVVVTFPTKPYASYEVYYGEEGFFLDNSLTADETIYGYEWPGKAVVELTGLSDNNKANVIVKAIPLNNCYAASEVVASNVVQILKADFAVEFVNALYTSANKAAGKARLTFVADQLNGEDIPVEAFTVYRYTSNSDKPWENKYEALDKKVTKASYDSSISSTSSLGDAVTVYYIDDDNVPVLKNVSYKYYVKAVYNGAISIAYNPRNNNAKYIALATADLAGGYKAENTATATFSADLNTDNTAAVKFDLFVKYPIGYTTTDTLYQGEFDTYNAALTSTLEECSKKVDLVAPATSNGTSYTINGVEQRYNTKSYNGVSVTLTPGATENNDSETIGKYYTFKFVVEVKDAEGKVVDTIVKSRGYYVKCDNTGTTPDYDTYSIF